MHLVSEWIPALEGVKEKLERGAHVADVGCGHGASTILLAKAFPKSKFSGFDYHEPSLVRARELARESGVADRITFQRASAKEFPGTFDLVAFFDCLHDMGDPVGVAAHVKSTLKSDGTWMIVEPFAGDRNGGKSQSDRPHILFGIDADLRARIIVAGSRSGSRHSGR